MASPAAPLFRDPIHDGAADPTLIWNRHEKSWWTIYTNRRANVPCPGLAWAHGTDLGVASSHDGGNAWLYRGTLRGLEFEPGRNTFWAPEVLWHAGRYHMYVSYIRGVPQAWSGQRHIVHMTSANLWDWEFQSVLPLSSDFVIDACVHPLPDGRWRMWYKDEADGSHAWAADSDDLLMWNVAGPVITDCAHEGPNVFHWQGMYWMLTDRWRGQGVYRSEDALAWEYQGEILGTPGLRTDDADVGRHADVVVSGGRAFVFYFTHPGGGGNPPEWSLEDKRTSLQVAELELVDGKPFCDRDRAFDFELLAADEH